MADHGVFTFEEATPLTIPIEGKDVTVCVGTAPVNMLDDPESAVNVPIFVTNMTEAMAQLGYCPDMAFSTNQAIYAASNIHPVSPFAFINVCDPKKHKKPIPETVVAVDTAEMEATVQMTRILRKGLVIKTVGDDPTTLVADTDYITQFDANGHLVICLVEGGAGEGVNALSVSGEMLDPEAVTAADVIGAYNPATGAETGLQLIRQIYPLFGYIPTLVIAPGFSQLPEVGLAMAAKVKAINGVFKGIALVDIDTDKARTYQQVKAVKEQSGFTTEACYPLWPSVKVGDMVLANSAVTGALIPYLDAQNEGVPYRSPSNNMLGVSGTCLADGTPVMLDSEQGSVVNTYGVTTVINDNGFKLWGNYTGIYPASGDAKDVWLPVRRMFNWVANTFILTYRCKVDNPMSRRLIENVIDSENMRLGAYCPRYMAGASVEYLAADNPTTNIIAGKMVFRLHIAPYTPAQEIDGILDYDLDTLTAVLRGE